MGLLLIIASSLSLPGYGQTPLFDKQFGNYHPPEYIPIDVATDLNGNVYAMDIYHERVRKFDQSGSLLAEFTFPEVSFNWVRGIVVDSLGNMYITDAAGATIGNTKLAGIFKFDADGNFVKHWSESSRGLGIDANNRIFASTEWQDVVNVYDTEGTLLDSIGAGIIGDPEDAAVGPDGMIYIADDLNSRISKFDPLGNLVTTWGSWGTGDSQFRNPVSISVDSSSNVFVTDRRNFKLKKFTSDGTFITSVGGQGEGDGLWQEPHGHTVDVFGNIWFATYHGHDIQKFDNDLNFLLKIEGDRAAGAGQFADVRGVAVDSQLNVYTADKWTQHVTKYDRDGNFIKFWGRRGQGEAAEFNFPRTVHVDSLDRVYVSDDGHIRRFDTEGNYQTRYGKYLYIQGLATNTDATELFISRTPNHKITVVNTANDVVLREWGGKGTGPGQFDNPKGMAIGPNGLLYVSDGYNSRVQVFDQDGTYLSEWGSWGQGPGEFRLTGGLAVDAAGRVYVGDLRNDRVQVFDAEGNYLTEFGESGTGVGEMSKNWSLATEGSEVIYVADVDNKSLMRWYYPQSLDPLEQPPFQTGTSEGYFLGLTEDGQWRLDWSNSGPQQIFSGNITCDASISGAQSRNFGPNDEITITSSTIDFVGITNAGSDGLRFNTVAPTQCTFDLFIDGKHNSSQVFIGEQVAIPVLLPVTLEHVVTVPPGC